MTLRTLSVTLLFPASLALADVSTAQPPKPIAPKSAAPQPAASPAPVVTASGLRYLDTKLGTGPEAKAGMKVTCHYTGTLIDGKKFDSSRDRSEPFVFNLGVGMVIKGWDEGIAGMKVGGRRQLHVKPELGYGARGFGTIIPPNSTLVFDVELLAVESRKPPAPATGAEPTAAADLR
jgi:FKBP-type peptidyl-prolyl cis-trans isomerase